MLILILNGFSLRDLWLQAPSKPDGRHGGRLWLRVAGLLMAYPTRRWRSAWFGIIVHSTQSVVLAAITLALVLS